MYYTSYLRISDLAPTFVTFIELLAEIFSLQWNEKWIFNIYSFHVNLLMSIKVTGKLKYFCRSKSFLMEFSSVHKNICKF